MIIPQRVCQRFGSRIDFPLESTTKGWWELPIIPIVHCHWEWVTLVRNVCPLISGVIDDVNTIEESSRIKRVKRRIFRQKSLGQRPQPTTWPFKLPIIKITFNKLPSQKERKGKPNDKQIRTVEFGDTAQPFVSMLEICCFPPSLTTRIGIGQADTSFLRKCIVWKQWTWFFSFSLRPLFQGPIWSRKKTLPLLPFTSLRPSFSVLRTPFQCPLPALHTISVVQSERKRKQIEK